MNFTVTLSDFQKILQKTLPAIPRKSTLPVLEHLHFALEGNTLKMIATDQDITIMSHLNVAGSLDGSLLVPARKLNDVTRALGTTGEFVFNSNFDNFDITIKTTTGKYAMKGLDPEEYLDIPELFESERPDITDLENGAPIGSDRSPIAQFTKDDIINIANNSVFCVSTDEYRPAMTGVLFQFRGNYLNVVATDSFRLAKIVQDNEKNNFPEDLDIIIPARAIELLKKADSDVILSFIEIQGKITHARFDMEDTVFITKIIDEKFPPYESVIPRETDHTAIVSQKTLLDSIKRIAILTSKVSHQVRFKFEKDLLIVSGEDEEFGDRADETIPIQYEGDEFLVGFNYLFVEDAIQAIDTTQQEGLIKLEFTDPKKPFLFKPNSDEEKILMLIMPVRLNQNA